MDFANERYVRLYVRDTVTWKRLGWDGQNALTQLLRKADRAGVVDLGGIEPWEALAVLCGAPEAAARLGVARAIELGCVVHDADRLVFPRYIEANETPMSDAQRARESRAKRATLSPTVTAPSPIVTECHAESRAVTPCHSVPSVPYLTDPTVPSRAYTAGAREDPSPLRIGMDFMQALNPSAFWDIGHWRRDLELLGEFPAAQRELALKAAQADSWCRANDPNPGHFVKHWAKWSRGKPAVTQVVPRRDIGPREPAKAEDYLVPEGGVQWPATR